MENSLEKRKDPRINIAIPLRYKEMYGKSYLAKGALTKDISNGGVRFNCDKFISLAQRLILEIALPSASQPVRVISKVVWIKKLNTGNAYEIGNHFIAATSKDETTISSYLEKALSPVA